MNIEDVKRPVKKGELYLVPCLVKFSLGETDNQQVWMDLSHTSDFNMRICPVINHPHSDRENGQKEVHYHIDYRFIKHKNNGNFPTVINKHPTHIYADTIRPTKDYGELEYFLLPVINEEFKGVTPVNLIKNSKLDHKCIHRGKCPHKGYDLSQVKPKDGKITCPLHGLEIDATTKEILNAP